MTETIEEMLAESVRPKILTGVVAEIGEKSLCCQARLIVSEISGSLCCGNCGKPVDLHCLA